MEWLNYHHLFYFWTIVQEGSLSKAAARLRLTHSTLSEQLKLLEGFFGEELFDRKGHRLVLTEVGAEVAQYAADIFHLGHELIEVTRGRLGKRRTVFRVGVLGTIPKTIAYRLLEPSLRFSGALSVEVRQGDLDGLVGMLSRNVVHVILTDQPPRDASAHRVHTHKLGETEVVLYASPRLAARYRKGFPSSLSGAPMLLPARATGLRQSIDRWLADRGLKVNLVGEIDDAALLRTFGSFAHGVFPVRSVLANEIEETHHVQRVGPLGGVRETYYAVSNERRVTHPQVLAIMGAAKERLLDALPHGKKIGSPGRSPRRRRLE